jgi:hypothetical protein
MLRNTMAPGWEILFKASLVEQEWLWHHHLHFPFPCIKWLWSSLHWLSWRLSSSFSSLQGWQLECDGQGMSTWCSNNKGIASIQNLGTMREHAGISAVQTYCLWVILDISKDNDKNKNTIMAAGALDDIVRALNTFAKCTSIQEKECGTIWPLCINTNNHIIWVWAGACFAIVNSLQNFIATKSLAQTGLKQLFGPMCRLSP